MTEKVLGRRVTEFKMLGLLERERDVLNEAESPCFIHTDTWDGNLMVKDGKLVGLIDFAAVLYGDPDQHL